MRAPEGFPTVEELANLASPFLDEIDAQISSFVAVYGNDDDLEELGVEGGVVESMTITYFGDVTVWDYPAGFREVSFEGELLYLSEDGTWQVRDSFEWPPFGPLPEWGIASAIASDVFEADPEVIGFEGVAGVPTLHLAVGDNAASVEEGEEGTSLRLQTVWEVTGLDIEPEGPLPHSD